jgi:hypothetical protein
MRWLAFGAVAWASTQHQQDDSLHQPFVNGRLGDQDVGFFVCTEPGFGTYGVNVSANSVLRGGGTGTVLRVTLVSEVECVAEGAPEASPTFGVAPPAEEPTVQLPPGGIIVLVTSTGGCAHTEPGVRSEDKHKPRVTNIRTGRAVLGATVEGEATGPALINNTASAVTDANGEATLIFGITAFGSYTSTVVRVILPDGTLAEIDPSSVLQVTNNVGPVCTPP